MDKIPILVVTQIPPENYSRVPFTMPLMISSSSLKRFLLHISRLGCNFSFFICIRFDLAWKDSDYVTITHTTIFIACL